MAAVRGNHIEVARLLLEHGANVKSHENEQTDEVMHTASCDNCKGTIKGIRWKCRQCRTFDLCHKCRQLNVHSEHEFNKIEKSLNSTSSLITSLVHCSDFEIATIIHRADADTRLDIRIVNNKSQS